MMCETKRRCRPSLRSMPTQTAQRQLARGLPPGFCSSTRKKTKRSLRILFYEAMTPWLLCKSAELRTERVHRGLTGISIREDQFYRRLEPRPAALRLHELIPPRLAPTGPPDRTWPLRPLADTATALLLASLRPPREPL